MVCMIRYAKIPDEPMGGMVAMKGTSSSASSSGEEDSSESESDGEEQRTQKLLALQQEVYCNKLKIYFFFYSRKYTTMYTKPHKNIRLITNIFMSIYTHKFL